MGKKTRKDLKKSPPHPLIRLKKQKIRFKRSHWKDRGEEVWYGDFGGGGSVAEKRDRSESAV